MHKFSDEAIETMKALKVEKLDRDKLQELGMALMLMSMAGKMASKENEQINNLCKEIGAHFDKDGIDYEDANRRLAS